MDRIAELRAKGTSWEAIGDELGITAEAARKRHGRTKSKTPKCEDTESNNSRELTYHGDQIKTVDELLKSADVDLKIWEVVEQTVNNWEVAGKNDGNPGLWKTGLRQIKVKLRRRAPKFIQEGIAELLKDVKPLALAKSPRLSKAATARQMLEVGIYDHHFGKLAWGKETGSAYDLEIAEREFRTAIDVMLYRVQGQQFEKIVLPLGNDFFHANDFNSNTANGTRVDSTDDRFSKVFRIGCRAVQYGIEKFLQVAPVEVIWVPGNHDRHTSWFLTEWLAAKFSGISDFRIDNAPGNRKYLRYGCTLLGYTHGDELKADKLPLLMATEAAGDWAASSFRSWRTGHLHKRSETRFNVGDTYQGVEVRVFPSLCGTDSWHHSNGFTGNRRMAECHIWDHEYGPTGYHVVNGNYSKA